MMSSMTCDVFCARAFVEEEQSRNSKFSIVFYLGYQMRFAKKACEAIDVQRRVVFFSLRANVCTGIRGVVLVVVVVVACAIFYASKTRSIFAFIFIVVVVVVSWYYYSRW